MERRCAVMAAAQRDAFAIGERGNIVRVHARELESYDRELGLAEDPAAGRTDRGDEAGVGTCLVGVRIECAREPDRGAEAGDADHVRGAGLEACWNFAIGRGRVTDGGDHASSALPWRHRVEDRGATPQNPGAGRAVELVRREGVEVAAERGDIDREVSHRLRAVDHEHRTHCVRTASKLRDRRDRARDIRDVRDGDEPRAVERDPSEIEVAGVVDRCDAKLGALLGADHLPGYEVRVVLELAHDHDIVARNVCARPGLGDEVERCGGAAREDDLVGDTAEKPSDLAPRGLDDLGRSLCESVDAAGRVAGVVGASSGHRVDDGSRAEGRGRTVQVGQPMAVHPHRQRRKLSTARCEIQHQELG